MLMVYSRVTTSFKPAIFVIGLSAGVLKYIPNIFKNRSKQFITNIYYQEALQHSETLIDNIVLLLYKRSLYYTITIHAIVTYSPTHTRTHTQFETHFPVSHCKGQTSEPTIIACCQNQQHLPLQSTAHRAAQLESFSECLACVHYLEKQLLSAITKG